jgi:pimeloyl-ACP methyl ester carboxylesterase
VRDNIVSPSNAGLLEENAEHPQVTMMQHSRHFPMIDEPDKFMSTLDSFLSSNSSEESDE